MRDNRSHSGDDNNDDSGDSDDDNDDSDGWMVRVSGGGIEPSPSLKKHGSDTTSAPLYIPFLLALKVNSPLFTSYGMPIFASS